MQRPPYLPPIIDCYFCSKPMTGKINTCSMCMLAHYCNIPHCQANGYTSGHQAQCLAWRDIYINHKDQYTVLANGIAVLNETTEHQNTIDPFQKFAMMNPRLNDT
jgi:hypothetical protein